MKKLSLILLTCLAVVFFNACDDNEDSLVTAKVTPEGVNFMNTPADAYILTNATSNNVAERFVWNAGVFDVQTPVNYDIQSSMTQDFAQDTLVGTTTQTNFPILVSDLMTLAQKAGLDNDPDTEAPNSGIIYFRIRAYLGNAEANTAMEDFSDVLGLPVVLSESGGDPAPAELPKIYVVGNFLTASKYGNDWTPADAVPIAAPEGQTNYEGFVAMDVSAPEYKFLPTNTSFDGDFGDNGSANGDYNGVLLEDGEVNCGTPDGTGGYFLVRANTDELTYSLTKTQWAIIGDATPNGWTSDTDMTYDPDTKTWTITTDLVEQPGNDDHGMKFRANDAWDLNFGDTNADGSLEFGGTNIAVPEDGNYTIVLDLSNPRQYTYSLTKN